MRDIPVANPWLAAVEPSPIGETKRWVLGRTFPADRPLIDLNQAFCLALMSIAKAGDEVILPRPHYFNHDMWLRMQGVTPVSLDFRPGSGAVPNAEDAAKLIGAKTRAIVLISPNNPTGAVYPRETIHAFYELAQRSGIALMLDETYKD